MSTQSSTAHVNSSLVTVQAGSVALAEIIGIGSDVRVRVTRTDTHNVWVTTADLRDAGTQLVLDTDKVRPEPSEAVEVCSHSSGLVSFESVSDSAQEVGSEVTTSNPYEKKKQARAQRLRDRADKAQRESDAQFGRARSLTAGIPMGQPILVGHHSEKRHRNTLAKSDNAMRKGCEASDKAQELARRAEAVENSTAISSDDPDAIAKIKERIQGLEAMQTRMREANKALRKNDLKRLADLGFTGQKLAALQKPDFMGRTGFPDYALTNNSGNIRRLKQRLVSLEALEVDREKAAALEEATGQEAGVEDLGNGVTLRDNAELNRVQLIFPGKPTEELRHSLKRAGFVWSYSEGAWQRRRAGEWILQTARELGRLYPAS